MRGTTDLPDVEALRVLEPPPGGIAILRERLDGEGRRRGWLWLAVPAMLAVVAILLLRRDDAAPSPAPTALADPQVSDGFYWVASRPAGPKPARAPLPEAPSFVSIDDAPRVSTIGQ